MIAQRSSKTALVTGGSSGISLCVVKTLILEGFKVTVLDLNEAGLCTIDEAGPDNLLFIPCDITDWKAVKAAFNQSHQYFGSIQVVVNGAGVYEPVRLVTPYGSNPCFLFFFFSDSRSIEMVKFLGECRDSRIQNFRHQSLGIYLHHSSCYHRVSSK